MIESIIYGVLYKFIDEINDTGLFHQYKSVSELLFICYTIYGLYYTETLKTVIILIGWIYVIAYLLAYFANIDLGNRDVIWIKIFCITVPHLSYAQIIYFMTSITVYKFAFIAIYFIFNLCIDNLLNIREEYSMRKIKVRLFLSLWCLSVILTKKHHIINATDFTSYEVNIIKHYYSFIMGYMITSIIRMIYRLSINMVVV